MEEVIISLEDVTIRYPDNSSFANINFEVKKGEHIALTGENDPLKNAVLEALAGKVGIIKGKTFSIANSEDTKRKLVAYVSSRHTFKNLSNTSEFYYQQRFNSTDSENSLTVEQYLKRIKIRDTTGHWNYIRIVERLNIQKLLDEEVIKLSNGETKRVLIAAALLSNPILLLLNNPLTGLDVESRKDINGFIDQIVDSGITVVISTSSTEVPDCISKIAVVEKDSKITICDKKDFHQQAFKAPINIIDEAEVKRSFFSRIVPSYEQVVYMKNVDIKYGDKIILENINWEIKQGERWALLGHNGAGKSTLLSLINADNPQAFANHIILFDRKKGTGESIWDIKKKIGFFSSELFQYFPLENSCLQVVESGFYDTVGLYRASSPKNAATALKWMKLLEVDHLSGKLLKNVSVIDQRLCLLARALVKNPVLLILDEPCQGFNEQQQMHFKQLIDVICEQTNITLIYVSHYYENIPGSVTKILRLQNGKVLENVLRTN